MANVRAGLSVQVGNLFAAIFFLIPLVIGTACAKDDDMVLELADVQFFRVQATGVDPVSLQISGLAFHSALVVGDITEAQDGSRLQVLVHLEPASSGRSGSFDYTLIIPKTVDIVVFGRSQVVVWDRQGVTAKPSEK